MKKLMENWQHFIQEVDETDIDQLRGILNPKVKKYIPFGDIFGGQWRITIPLEAPSVYIKKWKALNKFLTEAGWTPDVKAGTASREYDYTIPKGPKQGQKIKKKETKKIGKLLKLLTDFSEWQQKIYDSGKDIPTRSWRAEESPEAKELYDKRRTFMKAIMHNFGPAISHKTSAFQQNLYGAFTGQYSTRSRNFYGEKSRTWAKLWADLSEVLRSDPQALEPGPHPTMTVIISRHPIDVMRMSDHNNIESCHSRSGGYWKCAVDEAREGGAIAYIVNKDDLEGVDLEQHEIFADPERGVQGIVPLTRVRLRRIVNKKTKTDFAIPEMDWYGKRTAGFTKTLQDWAKQVQPELKNISDEEDYVYVGGSYADWEPHELLDAMGIAFEADIEHEPGFESPISRYRGQAGAITIANVTKAFASDLQKINGELIMSKDGKVTLRFWVPFKNIGEKYEEFDYSDLNRGRASYAVRDIQNFLSSHAAWRLLGYHFSDVVEKDKGKLIGWRNGQVGYANAKVLYNVIVTTDWNNNRENAFEIETDAWADQDLSKIGPGSKRVYLDIIKTAITAVAKFLGEPKLDLEKYINGHVGNRGKTDEYDMRDIAFQETIQEWQKYLKRKI